MRKPLVWEDRGHVVTSPELIAQTRMDPDKILLELWNEEQARRCKPVDRKRQVLRSWGCDDRNCC
jgi:hypothetical protein